MKITIKRLCRWNLRQVVLIVSSVKIRKYGNTETRKHWPSPNSTGNIQSPASIFVEKAISSSTWVFFLSIGRSWILLLITWIPWTFCSCKYTRVSKRIQTTRTNACFLVECHPNCLILGEKPFACKFCSKRFSSRQGRWDRHRISCSPSLPGTESSC